MLFNIIIWVEFVCSILDSITLFWYKKKYFINSAHEYKEYLIFTIVYKILFNYTFTENLFNILSYVQFGKTNIS